MTTFHPCPCGCPAEMHVGEIGCPHGLPDEPPCAPSPRTPHQHGGTDAPECTEFGVKCPTRTPDDGEGLVEAVLFAQWVDALWTTPCAHGGGYARDCVRCMHETAASSDWLAARDRRVRAEGAAEMDDLRAAYRTASEATDRFRDVVSECLGLDENPGDDALVAMLRAHHGKSGPEPTRWRDFLTGALAQVDQIRADRIATPEAQS